MNEHPSHPSLNGRDPAFPPPVPGAREQILASLPPSNPMHSKPYVGPAIPSTPATSVRSRQDSINDDVAGEIAALKREASTWGQAHSRMHESPKTDQFFLAFLQAQDAVVNPKKNKEVKTDKYRFKFADLSKVLEAVRPVLGDAGIVLIQVPTEIDGKMVLLTKLIHAASGQWLEIVLPLPPIGEPQAFGSRLSYLRRYVLVSLMGIAADDEDDDGGRASKRPSTVSDVEPHRVPVPQLADGPHETVLRHWARTLRGASDGADLHDGLSYWRHHAYEIHRIYQAPEAREFVEDTIAGTIGRYCGREVSNALTAALRMSTPREAEMFEMMIHGKWAQGLARAKEAMEESVWECVDWIIGNERARLGPKAKAKSVVEQKTAASMPPAEDVAPEPVAPVAAPAAAEPTQNSFLACLHDQFGDPITEPMFDPTVWVKAWARERTNIDPQETQQFDEANGHALEEASRMPAAAALIADAKDADIPDGNLLVAMPTNDAGSAQFAAYLANVTARLDLLGRAALDRWPSINAAVLKDMPDNMRVRALQRLAKRRTQLGMGPLQDDGA